MDILKKILNKFKKMKNGFNLKKYKKAEEEVINIKNQEEEIDKMTNWAIENIGNPTPSQYDPNWASQEYQNTFLNVINKYKVPVISIKQYISRNLGNPNPEPIDPSWNTEEFRQLFMRVTEVMAFGNMQVEKSMEELMSNTNIKQQYMEEEIPQPKEQLQNEALLNSFYNNPKINKKLETIKKMLSGGGRDYAKANEVVDDVVLEIIGGKTEEGRQRKNKTIDFFARNYKFLPDNIKNTPEFNSITNMIGDEKEKKQHLYEFLSNPNSQTSIISQINNLILNKNEDFLNSITSEIGNNAKFKMFPRKSFSLEAFKKNILTYLFNEAEKKNIDLKNYMKKDVMNSMNFAESVENAVQIVEDFAKLYRIFDKKFEENLNKKLRRGKGKIGELESPTSLSVTPGEDMSDVSSLITEKEQQEKIKQKEGDPEEQKRKALTGLISEKEIVYPQIKELGEKIADKLLSENNIKDRTDGERLKLYINLLNKNINEVISLDNPDFKVKKDVKGNEYATFSIPKEEGFKGKKSMIKIPLDYEKRLRDMRMDSIVDSELLMKSFSNLGVLKQKIKNELKVRSVPGVAITLASEIRNYLNQFKKEGEYEATEQEIYDFIDLTNEQNEDSIKYLQRDFVVKDYEKNQYKAQLIDTLNNVDEKGKPGEFNGNNIYKYIDNLGVERYYMTRNGENQEWRDNPEKKYMEFYMNYDSGPPQKADGYIRHNMIRPQFFAKTKFLNESLNFIDQYNPEVFRYFLNFLKFGKDITESTKKMPYSKTIDYYKLRNEIISEELLNKIIGNRTVKLNELENKAKKEKNTIDEKKYKEQIKNVSDEIKKLVSDHNKNLKAQKKSSSYNYMLKTSYVKTVNKLNNYYNLKKQFSNIKVSSKNIQYVDILISKTINEFKDFINKF